MENKPLRVRFAPSPTGPLHIGGVRTALYNYLFARKYGGTMILRIEDTDQARYVEGAERYIIEALSWCGITFDEGVHVGGPYAPYRQSDRKDIYFEYAEKLVHDGFAYYAFDTPEEIEERRKSAERSTRKPFQYDVFTRKSMRNSLTLPASEVSKLLASGMPFVIRIKIPQDIIIEINDIIRGHVAVESNLLDDKVLFKSDGMPTYHLANVVDDFLMGITHVIRGEEWLPSAPLHALLYRFLGIEKDMPQFAHLPLLLRPDGNGKLSKRDGDRLGFPVFPLRWVDPKTGEISSGYRESGYYPEAFVNILALLGWNPGTAQECFSMNELIDQFSLERVSKSGAKFDVEKARWFNQHYLRMQSAESLCDQLLELMNPENGFIDRNKLTTIIPLVIDRVNFVHELWGQLWFFFEKPTSYDVDLINKRWKPETSRVLQWLAEVLGGITDFSAGSLSCIVKAAMEKESLNPGSVMLPLRIALVGSAMGPDLFQIMHYLGKKETLERIDGAINSISVG